MIGYLKGSLFKTTPEVVLLDVSGVGYEVHVPLSTYYEIERATQGAPVGLFIHTHIREDDLTLFGFWTEQEKHLFERLIGVSGIGPRLARVVLSGMSPGDLVSALASGDVARLSTIPGIGKKTAERMVLELRDRVAELVTETPAIAASPATDDLVSALINLGYKRKLADQAVAAVRRDHPDAEFPELLRQSLKRLSRA